MRQRHQASVLGKENFSAHFSSPRLKPVTYNDTSSRNVNSHSIRSIAWNPHSTLVATGAANSALRVWNPEKNNVKHSTELKGHTSTIEKVAFNPSKDGELCSVSADGTVKFWDVRTKSCFNEIKGLGDAFTLAWAPDGQNLVVGNKADKLFLLSPTQSTPLASYQQPIQTNQIAFCWGGEKLFVTTGLGTTRILSFPSFEPLYRLNYLKDTRTDGSGRGGGDGGRDSVSSDTLEEQLKQLGAEFSLAGHTSSCLSVELQPSGRYLATGGSDSIIALWDTTDWICQRTLTHLEGPVRSISFTFDGSYICGGSEEGSGIDIIHTETGDRVHSFKTVGPTPVVSWAHTRYVMAYSDAGSLRTIGIDFDRK